MKSLPSLILTALAITIVFTACTGGSSDKTSAGDTSAVNTTAPAVNGNDASQQRLEANKTLVKDFYQSLYGDKDSSAIDKYVADNIIQHNPLLQDGKEWLKNALRPFLENPNIEKTKIEIAHIAADGDMVWVLVKDVTPNGKIFARVNIFRIENGKVAEAWKVSEPVDPKSENKHGTF